MRVLVAVLRGVVIGVYCLFCFLFLCGGEEQMCCGDEKWWWFVKEMAVGWDGVLKGLDSDEKLL